MLHQKVKKFSKNHENKSEGQSSQPDALCYCRYAKKPGVHTDISQCMGKEEKALAYIRLSSNEYIRNDKLENRRWVLNLVSKM